MVDHPEFAEEQAFEIGRNVPRLRVFGEEHARLPAISRAVPAGGFSPESGSVAIARAVRKNTPTNVKTISLTRVGMSIDLSLGRTKWLSMMVRRPFLGV